MQISEIENDLRNPFGIAKEPKCIRRYLQLLGPEYEKLSHPVSSLKPQLLALPILRPCFPKSPIKLREHKDPSLLKPSEAIVNQFIIKPTTCDPPVECVEGFPHLVPSRMLIYMSPDGVLEHRRQMDSGDYADKRAIRATSITLSGIEVKPNLFSEPLSILSLQPFTAPFVPAVLSTLINRVEINCRRKSWHSVLKTLIEYEELAEYTLKRLIACADNPNHLNNIIKVLPTNILIETTRLFLRELGVKPLHFRMAETLQLAQNPLLDFFYRPTPGMPDLVKRACLTATIGQVDTLAFVMIHLIHAFESAGRLPMAKSQLANIYGPLLITFTERPMLFGTECLEIHSLEAAIFGVILETCNVHYWNHLTMLKVKDAFKPFESETQRLHAFCGPMQNFILPPINGVPCEVLENATKRGPKRHEGIWDKLSESSNEESIGKFESSTVLTTTATMDARNPPEFKLSRNSMSYISLSVPQILALTKVDTSFGGQEYLRRKKSTRFCRRVTVLIDEIQRVRSGHAKLHRTENTLPREYHGVRTIRIQKDPVEFQLQPSNLKPRAFRLDGGRTSDIEDQLHSKTLRNLQKLFDMPS